MFYRRCHRCWHVSDHVMDIYCPQCGHRLELVRVREIGHRRDLPED